jgi:hypothetical protein
MDCLGYWLAIFVTVVRSTLVTSCSSVYQSEVRPPLTKSSIPSTFLGSGRALHFQARQVRQLRRRGDLELQVVTAVRLGGVGRFLRRRRRDCDGHEPTVVFRTDRVRSPFMIPCPSLDFRLSLTPALPSFSCRSKIGPMGADIGFWLSGAFAGKPSIICDQFHPSLPY